MEIPPTKARLVSYTISCPHIPADHFLRSAEGNTRFYWQDSNGESIYAGFGTATELVAWSNRFDTIAEQARQLFADAVIVGDDPAPRLFGGFSFSEDFVPDNTWAIYAPAYFVLPHYQLTERGGVTWLTLNILLADDEKPDLPEMKAALIARYESLCNHISTPKDASPTPTMIRYPMPFETWEQEIQNIIQRTETSDLKKVVLARVCELQFNAHINLDRTFAYLNEHYPDCYRFLFEPRPFNAFYGATPELLARVEGDRVTTMGLAGSIKRGKTPAEDAELGKQIFNDPKERHEHALVVDAIRERLGKLTSRLDVPDEPQVYRLSNIQHLHTPISGQLKEPMGILPVVETLHPTPALGGSPRETALEIISHAEPVPRGWYAAPIGWIDQNLDGAFGVAIRSAVTQHRRVWLYAGAGIVKNSVPQKEWDETALKFKPMLNALGIEDAFNVNA